MRLHRSFVAFIAPFGWLQLNSPAVDASGPRRPWTFNDDTRTVVAKHLQVIAGAMRTVEGIRGFEKARVDMYQSIHRLGRILLVEYHDYLHFIEQLPKYFIQFACCFCCLSCRVQSFISCCCLSSLCSRQSFAILLRTIDQDFRKDRTEAINLLRAMAISHSPAASTSTTLSSAGQSQQQSQQQSRDLVFAFAEEFQDFEALVSLCDEEMAAREERTHGAAAAAGPQRSATNPPITAANPGLQRLVAYMNPERYGRDFADVLFQLYQQQGLYCAFTFDWQPLNALNQHLRTQTQARRLVCC